MSLFIRLRAFHTPVSSHWLEGSAEVEMTGDSAGLTGSAEVEMTDDSAGLTESAEVAMTDDSARPTVFGEEV